MAQLKTRDAAQVRGKLPVARRRVRRELLRALMPVSSATSFSRGVCGLAGCSKGCWRNRRPHPPEDVGVGALPNPSGELVGWIVFTRMATGKVTSVRWQPTRPSDAGQEGLSQAIFGIRDASSALQANERRMPVPSFAEYRTYASTSEWTLVEDWLGTSTARTNTGDLFNCFGSDTFSRLPVVDAPYEMSVSIADLAEAYLDSSCSRYRQHELGAQFGVTLCKLRDQGIDLNDLDGGAFGDLAITFSRYDHEHHTVDYLRMPHIGGLDRELLAEAPTIQQELQRAFVPVHAQGQREIKGGSARSFAECFLGPGRGTILPSEIEHRYLSFSIGEISVYLLHWLLLRIFASDDPASRAFVTALVRWVHFVPSREATESVLNLEHLLSYNVLPAFDASTFTGVAPNDTAARFLGFFRRPVAFREVIGIAGFGREPRAGRPFLQPERFLAEEFAERSAVSGQGYHELPMFSGLDWQASALVRSVVDIDAIEGQPDAASGLARDVAGVLATITAALYRRFEAAIEVHDHEVSIDTSLSRLAATTLQADTAQCVFPIGHVLTHWPCNVGVSHYFIVPCWDAVVGGTQRPVIFAHVFARGLGRNPSEAAVTAYVDELFYYLIPCGGLIARSYYDAQYRRAAASEREAEAMRLSAMNSYKIGHPLKHRVTPLRRMLKLAIGATAVAPEMSALHADLSRADDLASELERLGHLLDAVGETFAHGPESNAREVIFERKPDWQQTVHYDLPARLGHYARIVDVAVSVGQSALGARVEGWFGPAEHMARPADLFFDEILYELLWNAQSHFVDAEMGTASPLYAVRPTVQVALVEIPTSRERSVTALTVSNSCERDPCERVAWLSDEFQEWETEEKEGAGTGGLFFVALFLRRTGAGRLWVRRAIDGGGFHFVLALELRGLVRGAGSS